MVGTVAISNIGAVAVAVAINAQLVHGVNNALRRSKGSVSGMVYFISERLHIATQGSTTDIFGERAGHQAEFGQVAFSIFMEQTDGFEVAVGILLATLCSDQC